MYRGGCSNGGGAISCSTDNVDGSLVNFEVSLIVFKVNITWFVSI